MRRYYLMMMGLDDLRVVLIVFGSCFFVFVWEFALFGLMRDVVLIVVVVLDCSGVIWLVLLWWLWCCPFVLVCFDLFPL